MIKFLTPMIHRVPPILWTGQKRTWIWRWRWLWQPPPLVLMVVVLIISSHVIRPLTPLQTMYYWKACTLINRVTHNICYLKLHHINFIFPVSKKFSFLLQLTKQMNHEPKDIALSWILMFNSKKATGSESYSKMATQVPLKLTPQLQELALSIT